MYKIFAAMILLLSIHSNLHANKFTPETKPEAKIVNGTKVSSSNENWRFTVALKYDGDMYCGGSLIAPNWVLTAAHCIKGYTADDYDTVGVGSYNLNQMTDYSVKRFIVHPLFNSETMDYDIGLVELDRKINENIAPIQYDVSHKLTARTPTKVAGWGTMREGDAYYPENLREARVPIVDFDYCNSSDSYDGDLTDNMICAGYLHGTRDSCQGDSGGPLVVDHTLVGIVSWGNGCAKKNFPGVYTKVQNFTDWIQSYVPAHKITKSWIPVLVDEITIYVPFEDNHN